MVDGHADHKFKKFVKKVLKFEKIRDTIPVLKISLSIEVYNMKINKFVGGGQSFIA